MNTLGQETTYTLLQQNRTTGLQLLYERYGKRLFSYAITSWHTTEDTAWDLVYDTLLKTTLSVNHYEFESEAKFASFIFSIFCNLLRHHYRDKKRRAERMSMVNFDEALLDQAQDSTVLTTEREVQAKLVEEFLRSYWEEQPVSRLHLDCLQAVLDELEDWERVLLLQRAQNVAYSEIASFVNKPADQLKVYHQRARRKVTKRFVEKLNEIKSEINRDKLTKRPVEKLNDIKPEINRDEDYF